ncbi:Uncharacterized protein APZ42_009836, partial [Daphnia magna]
IRFRLRSNSLRSMSGLPGSGLDASLRDIRDGTGVPAASGELL